MTRAIIEAEDGYLGPAGGKRGEFSVCQFFMDGTYEYVRRWVAGEEAVMTFKRMTETVGARHGFVTRVIITDGGDFTNMEWEFGKGLTFPKREDIGQ